MQIPFVRAFRIPKKNSLGNTVEVYGESLHRSILRIENPRADIANSGGVENSTAHDVRSLLERKALGHPIINDHVAITVNADDFLAVEPPNGSRIGTDSQSHSARLLGAIHHGDRPKQDIKRWLVQRVSEVIEVDMIYACVNGMPHELTAVNRHSVAVARNYGVLAWEVVGLDGRLDKAIVELGVGPDLDRNRLENEPTLNETIGVETLLESGRHGHKCHDSGAAQCGRQKAADRRHASHLIRYEFFES